MLKQILLFVILFSPYCYANDTVVLQRLLNRYDSLSGNFKQVTQDEAGVQLQNSKGKFSWQQPNKLSWSTTKPNQQKIIADGQSIWFIQPSLKQAIHQSQAQLTKHNPLLLIFNDPERLSKTFIVKQDSSNQGYFKLIPKSSDQFSKLTILFKQQDITQICYVDLLNQTTCISFENLQFNQQLNTNTFKFVNTNDLDIIEG